MVGMKHLALLIVVVVLVGGCGEAKVVPNSPEAKAALEAAIRKATNKPEGELTKADLEKGKELHVRGKKLTDVSVLAGLTELKTLNLSFNKLTDLSPLAGLKQIEELDLRSNQLTDVSALAGLKQLETLDLGFNQLTDVSSLAGLKRLKELDLGNNNLTDKQLKNLAGLKHLEWLYLENNPNLARAEIAKSGIAKLQKALPKCKIYSNPKK